MNNCASAGYKSHTPADVLSIRYLSFQSHEYEILNHLPRMLNLASIKPIETSTFSIFISVLHLAQGILKYHLSQVQPKL